MPPKRSRGKQTDPNKPKGRTSAYAFFVQGRRDFYKKKALDIKFTEFSKECSDLWKKMTDKDKREYHAKADEDKERYEEEMRNYVPPAQDNSLRGVRQRGKKTKRKKDPNAPKRPLSAFIIFCRDKRPLLKEQKPNASVGDIAKELGKAWRIMTDDQKEPYDKQAKEDRVRYEGEKEAYVAPDENDMEDDEEDEEDED